MSLVTRGEKLVYRETHFAEQVTRIIRCRAAFLVGQAVVVDWNQHLYIAHKLHNGENADRHIDHSLAFFGKPSAVHIADMLRDVPAAATATVLLTLIGQPAVEYDRLRYLYAAPRHVAGRHLLTVVLFRPEFAAEYLYTSFASVQDHFFVKHSDAFHGRAGDTVAGKDLQLYAEEEGQITGIVAAVKGQ